MTRFIASPRAAELFRYGLASVLSASVTLGLPVVLHQFLGVPVKIAVAAAFLTAFVVNFVSTRSFVFKSDGKAHRDLGRYVFTSIAFRVAEYLAFLALYSTGIVYYVAQIIVVGSALILKFLAFKLFVYRKAPSTSASQ